MKAFSMAHRKKAVGIAIIAAALILLSMFWKWDLLAESYILLGLLCSCLTAFLLYRSVHVEKLMLVILGIFFSYVSIIGFFLNFFRTEIRMVYFVSCFFLLSVVLGFFWEKRKFKRPEVRFDLRRLVTVALIFLVSFSFYLYPSLPNLTSPCTPGFDCSHHMEYSAAIYEKKQVVAPVDAWEYYPFGLHVNAALLSKSFTSKGPSETNFFYPFMSLITALTVVMSCGILLDRKINKIYVLLLAALLMLSVYPASSLIGYGFWAQVFGTYFIILFFWVLDDYQRKTEHNIIFLLSLFSVGAFLSYQVLVAMPIVVGLLVALLVSSEITKKRRAAHFVLFFSVFLLFFSLNTYDNYMTCSATQPQDTTPFK
jgi:hypothetical protein